MSVLDLQALQSWIGRTQTRCDVIAAAPVAALSASLDYPQPLALPGETLPSGWHWLYFQDAIAASSLAVDGHAQRGDFIPPVPLPRRMWASSRLRFVSPLKLGADVQRISTIVDVRHKRGRSGELVFVTVQHQVYQGDGLAIEEEQNLVYRESGARRNASEFQSAPAEAQWCREVLPDSVLLFRYSALTFNSHRIHYDRDYAVREEGYASLVVQAPLTATLLLDLLHRELPGAEIATFEFRAIRPLLEGSPMKLQGRADKQDILLWALDESGALAMEARACLIDG